MTIHAPGQLQTKASTFANRYPETFAAAERMTAGISGRRVLSFGCSLGLECTTLHDIYFVRPDDTIVGIDINARAIQYAHARNARPRVTYYHPDNPKLGEDQRGFDVIFAMAVFAVTGSDELDDISGEMPFSAFVEACAYLDSRLKPGGLLVIANTNYRFTDIPFASRYVAHRDPTGRANRRVRMFDPNGRVSAEQIYPLTIFRKS